MNDTVCQHCGCVRLGCERATCPRALEAQGWPFPGNAEPDRIAELEAEVRALLDERAETSAKLLEAALRIEWLERQLAKCSASWKDWFANGCVYKVIGRPDDRDNRPLLITSNLTDPRLGK